MTKIFDETPSSEAALIVHPVIGRPTSIPLRSVEQQVAEIEGLAQAISLDVTDTHIIKIGKISPSHFLSKGIVKKLSQAVKSDDIALVIVNHTLSPVQQRNLERAWKAKVIDRTGLILEIFGQRAQTKEGRIQVELAALDYQRSRLVRSWTHLERQRGGLGKTGGPGETQLEIDRRIITERITSLKKDLEKVRKTRDLGRKSRERVPFPIVALVGYTNAGKSTLFNRLTGAKVFAEDLLFATLDPTMRKVDLPNGQSVILSDTVGFLSDLPTGLIEAFKSTLEQVEYANVILHVRDISGPDQEAQREDVIKILQELGIEYESDTRIIEVLNKVDQLAPEKQEDIKRKTSFAPNQIALSAMSGEGVEDLLEEIQKRLSEANPVKVFHLDISDGKVLAWLYAHADVLEKQETEEGALAVTVRIAPDKLGQFEAKFGYSPQ